MVFFCGAATGEIEMGSGAFEEAEEVLFIADDVAGIRIGNENSKADGFFGVLG